MAYIESVLLGIALAAIPGPVFFEVLRRTLTKGFWSGTCLVIGVFLADSTILMLTFFGINRFLLFKSARLALFLLGGAILIWIGYSGLKIKNEDIIYDAKKDISDKNSAFTGFALAISNPLAIVILISVGGAYLSRYGSGLNAAINTVLIASGAMLFFLSLELIIYVTRNKIPAKYILYVSKIFGIALIIYGFYFLYQFATVLSLQ